jgi:hypothetical protein
MNTELVPHSSRFLEQPQKAQMCFATANASLPFPFLSFASFIACVGGFRQLKLAMLESTNRIQPRRRFFRVSQLR